MPIGKSSITKRVAKQTEETVVEKLTPPTTKKNIAPELVATVGVAPEKKTATKQTATKTSTAKKTETTKTATKSSTQKKTSCGTKKPSTASTTTAKKPTPKKAAPEKKSVETTVLANVAPETVEAVVGHKENAKIEKVQIGGKLPYHLL